MEKVISKNSLDEINKESQKNAIKKEKKLQNKMNYSGDTRDEFIENNMGLVHLIAHKFTGRGIEYDDLFQAGCMGLIKAVDGFDKSRGIMFSTYGVPVIMGEIRRLFRDGGSIKISRSLKEISLKINRAKIHLSGSLGREPQISEIANYLNVSEEQVAEGIAAQGAVCSLTESSDDGKIQIDVPIAGYDLEITDKISIEESLKCLANKDRDLVFLRFVSGKTQSETADILKMTQVQVSRREKKILMLLRQFL